MPRYVYMPSANSHIYQNCYDIAQELTEREVMPECRLLLEPEWDASGQFPLESLKAEHLGVSYYDPHPAIKIAVN